MTRERAGAVSIAALSLTALAATACDCNIVEVYDENDVQIGTREYCDFIPLFGFANIKYEFKPGEPYAKIVEVARRAFGAKAQRISADPNAVTIRAPADIAVPNFAELRLPYELIAPFRVECVAGLCDPAFYPAPTATFGLSVVERTGALREFSVDCSRVGGITSTANFGTPAPQAFAGAQRVDVALEHDGTDLIAFARRHESGEWLEVSRTPLAAPGPFLPKLGARDFDPGQMVTFYYLRVPANAPFAPGQATPQQEAVRKLADAFNGLADGVDALVAETPDPAAASLEIQAANQRVQEALTALDAAASPGKKLDPATRKQRVKLRKARKAARIAAKRVTQAVAKLQVNGAEKPHVVLKRVSSAAVGLVQAADQILPDDLRAAIGGLTFKRLVGR